MSPKSFYLMKISLKELINIIFYSIQSLSNHTGLIVHAAAAFKKNIIDISSRELIYIMIDGFHII
jgi:hypothetical protein